MALDITSLMKFVHCVLTGNQHSQNTPIQIQILALIIVIGNVLLLDITAEMIRAFPVLMIYLQMLFSFLIQHQIRSVLGNALLDFITRPLILLNRIWPRG